MNNLFCDVTGLYDPNDIALNRHKSFPAYISALFFLPLLLCPNSLYARFHANQGLILFIVWGVFRILSRFLYGFLLFDILYFLVRYLVLGLSIYGIYNAFTGKAVEFPLIGKVKLIK